MRQIFFDMDGVLADTDRYVSERLGMEIGTWSAEEFWSIMNREGAFEDLPVMEGAKGMVEAALDSGHRVGILSSVGDRDTRNYIAVQKTAWLENHFPEVIFSSITFVSGAKKKGHLAKPGSILIDDYWKAIDSFRDAGGNAILFLSSEHATEELLELLRDEP